MVEVLIVILIVSTTFIGIITGIITTTNYLTETKQKVIALNLAKEGVEIMYNIRNTNRRRWEEKKDKCWLKSDPFLEGTNTCKNDWITPGRWTIVKTGSSITGTGGYYSLHRLPFSSTLSEETEMTRNANKFQEYVQPYISVFDEDARLYLIGGKRYNTGDVDKPEGDPDPTGGEIYRYIFVDGLYKKGDSNSEKMNCNGYVSSESDCGSGAVAKELRFCSIVFYTKPKLGRVQICSIMTNFE